MKTQKLFNSLLIAGLLSIPALSMAAMDGKGSGDMDKTKAMSKDHDMMRDKTMTHDAVMDRDQKHDQDMTKDRLKDGSGIYGSKIMNDDEIKQLRAEMSEAKTKEERLKIQAQHREEMTIRAKEQNVELADEE
ncbi:MAG: hypothetical protein P1U57_14055 [Oleibacter sp.]|nr:hypothetical protein [Thalassolituus sp.]